MAKQIPLLTVFMFFYGFLNITARPSLKEIRSASNNVLAVYITGDSRDMKAVGIEDTSR